MYLGWHFLSETKHLEIVSISRQDGSRIIRITIFKKLHNCNDHDINILLISILTHCIGCEIFVAYICRFLHQHRPRQDNRSQNPSNYRRSGHQYLPVEYNYLQFLLKY